MQQWVTIKEAGKITGFCRATIRARIKDGSLKAELMDYADAKPNDDWHGPPVWMILKSSLLELQKMNGLTVQDVAFELGITEVAVLHKIKTGKLKAVKRKPGCGKGFAIDPEEVKRLRKDKALCPKGLHPISRMKRIGKETSLRCWDCEVLRHRGKGRRNGNVKITD